MPAPVALVVVDFQKAFDDAGHWGPRNNPACEENVGALIEAWRECEQPIVVVRHDSVEEGSLLRPGQPGNALKDVVRGEPDLLVVKHVNSAFHGDPDLAAWLRANDIAEVVICGIQTNMCCETTARVGANLGSTIGADELARVTAANLDAEFGRVVSTAAAIAMLRPLCEALASSGGSRGARWRSESSPRSSGTG
jgi:nicotinamidase-related amidase